MAGVSPGISELVRCCSNSHCLERREYSLTSAGKRCDLCKIKNDERFFYTCEFCDYDACDDCYPNLEKIIAVPIPDLSKVDGKQASLLSRLLATFLTISVVELVDKNLHRHEESKKLLTGLLGRQLNRLWRKLLKETAPEMKEIFLELNHPPVCALKGIYNMATETFISYASVVVACIEMDISGNAKALDKLHDSFRSNIFEFICRIKAAHKFLLHDCDGVTLQSECENWVANGKQKVVLFEEISSEDYNPGVTKVPCCPQFHELERRLDSLRTANRACDFCRAHNDSLFYSCSFCGFDACDSCFEDDVLLGVPVPVPQLGEVDEIQCKAFRDFSVNVITSVFLRGVRQGFAKSPNFRIMLRLMLFDYLNDCYMSLLKNDNQVINQLFEDMNHDPICIIHSVYQTSLDSLPNSPILDIDVHELNDQVLEAVGNMFASRVFTLLKDRKRAELVFSPHTCPSSTLEKERQDWINAGKPEFEVLKLNSGSNSNEPEKDHCCPSSHKLKENSSGDIAQAKCRICGHDGMQKLFTCFICSYHVCDSCITHIEPVVPLTLPEVGESDPSFDAFIEFFSKSITGVIVAMIRVRVYVFPNPNIIIRYMLAEYLNSCWILLMQDTDEYLRNSFNSISHSPSCVFKLIFAASDLKILPNLEDIEKQEMFEALQDEVALELFRTSYCRGLAQELKETVADLWSDHDCHGDSLEKERSDWREKGMPSDIRVISMTLPSPPESES